MEAGVWLLPALQHPGRAQHRRSAECLLSGCRRQQMRHLPPSLWAGLKHSNGFGGRLLWLLAGSLKWLHNIFLLSFLLLWFAMAYVNLRV